LKEITLAHGAGGRLMQELIEKVIVANITNKSAGGVGLEALDDGASLRMGEGELVIATDAHVVSPLFFPGGDIGRLAVYGTANDIAVMGAKPVAIASALVVEEGFSRDELERVIRSMDSAARECGVAIITGDTKVVERGKLDKLVVTTTGVGIAKKVITDSGIEPGDAIIITGTIGDHGTALLAYREGFEFETKLESDLAPLWPAVERALGAGRVKAMKDPTRGGVASALNEWAHKAEVGIVVREDLLPVREEVRAACELLGIDPLSVGNEGKALIAVPREDAGDVLEAIRSTKVGRNAAIIGEVVEEHPGKVVLETEVGGRRILDWPLADPVPRIC
jgi:hydrogenase expression/formation protein HypE